MPPRPARRTLRTLLRRLKPRRRRVGPYTLPHKPQEVEMETLQLRPREDQDQVMAQRKAPEVGMEIAALVVVDSQQVSSPALQLALLL